VVRNGRSQFGDNDAGPVDHTLAVLFVHGPEGKLRGVLANYACHCTTLGGEFNQLHGDWCGYAQAALERDHPGAVALVSIGCGGDANPFPRGRLEHAQAHGDEIAAEVRRLLTVPSKPLALPEGKLKRFDLDFDPLPTRAQWEERAQKPGIVGYHAKKNLARLGRGEKLPTKLPYVVQTWTFDDRLAMVFLAGEVVIDYQRRLKREFDETRLWVNAYANDVPCYIPSRRILAEGGFALVLRSAGEAGPGHGRPDHQGRARSVAGQIRRKNKPRRRAGAALTKAGPERDARRAGVHRRSGCGGTARGRSRRD
jgi:hypothetical protein